MEISVCNENKIQDRNSGHVRSSAEDIQAARRLELSNNSGQVTIDPCDFIPSGEDPKEVELDLRRDAGTDEHIKVLAREGIAWVPGEHSENLELKDRTLILAKESEHAGSLVWQHRVTPRKSVSSKFRVRRYGELCDAVALLVMGHNSTYAVVDHAGFDSLPNFSRLFSKVPRDLGVQFLIVQYDLEKEKRGKELDDWMLKACTATSHQGMMVHMAKGYLEKEWEEVSP